MIMTVFKELISLHVSEMNIIALFFCEMIFIISSSLIDFLLACLYVIFFIFIIVAGAFVAVLQEVIALYIFNCLSSYI